MCITKRNIYHVKHQFYNIKAMKKLILIFGLFFLTTGAMAQSPLVKGGKQFNAGVGLSGWGVPIYLGLDFGVHPDISLGVEVSFRRYKEKWNKTYYYYHNVMGVSGNFNYHFNRILQIPPKWDFYAGLNIGYYIWSSPDYYPGDHVSGLGLGLQVGGRYYLTEKVGLNLEFGGGNAFSGGKFGVSVLF